jgi:hypothetical protein
MLRSRWKYALNGGTRDRLSALGWLRSTRLTRPGLVWLGCLRSRRTVVVFLSPLLMSLKVGQSPAGDREKKATGTLLGTSASGVQYASSEGQAAVRGTLWLDGGSVGVGGLASISVELLHTPPDLAHLAHPQATVAGTLSVWYRVWRVGGCWLTDGSCKFVRCHNRSY